MNEFKNKHAKLQTFVTNRNVTECQLNSFKPKPYKTI